MNNLSQIKEIFTSNKDSRKQIHKLLVKGKIRKIASRLYTSNLKDSSENIVRKYLWQIVGEYFPAAIICDRTGIENKPDKDGNIYVISNRTRKIQLPGNIKIIPRKGVGSIENDKPFIKSLYLPSLARSLLENIKASRSRNGELSRTLSKEELEKKLFDILMQNGDLNKIRDQAKLISHELSLQEEYKKLNSIIGTFLGTKSSKISSKIGTAFLEKLPYDEKRVQLFNNLHFFLRNQAPFCRAVNYSDKSWLNLSFYEAYFSNFIEGTEFDVEEAKKIIFDGQVPIDRPEDAHDIIGTYKIISSREEMSKIPETFEELVTLLKSRHLAIMEGRARTNPGEFKTQTNRVGSTIFVEPKLVKGTLKEGFELYRSLECPFYRAVFIKFLISEIHPFFDGNGRVARIMMNAELVHANEAKIIIPTIYRANYLSALKALSQNNIYEPLVRCLSFAQKYVQNIDWEDFEIASTELKESNAFMDSFEAEEKAIRLRINK
jgi:hypothetical protein